MYTRDPAGWQLGLAISAASLVTSVRIAWAKGEAVSISKQEGGSEVVTGTTPILGFEASVLFDLGATHSFVSIMFVRLSRLVMRTLEPSLVVTTPVGKTMVCKREVCECPIRICGRVLPVNFVVLLMFSYGIILRMDWLTKHSAIIDCAKASDAYTVGRRKSDVLWITSEVFTSNDFGRAS
jgi:hypothetical protein